MKHFDRFIETIQSYADLPCIDDLENTFLYADLLREVERWQASLDDMDVREGSVVAVRTDYSLSAVAVLIALMSRRAIAALVPRFGDVEKYLASSHATVLLSLAMDGSYDKDVLPTPLRHLLLDRLVAMRDGGLIIFTSGSTGNPKAALLSIEGFLCKFNKPGRRLRTLAFMLLDHVAGLDILFYALKNGGTMILTRRRDPKAVMDVVRAKRVELLAASPSFLRLLCETDFGIEHDGSHLKHISYGSEPMDPQTLVRLNARFPHVKFNQSYGTTETGSPRSVSRGNDSLWLKIEQCGVETKVVEGVLWLRSEGAMLGYLNAPAPIDDQGWYRTGDLVETDGEWIRFRGREVDVISVGGEKVAPGEVEETILELPEVTQVLVSGAPSELLGQIVTARVVLSVNAVDGRAVIKRIREHCRQRLAPHKVPVKISVVAESLTGMRLKMLRLTESSSGGIREPQAT